MLKSLILGSAIATLSTLSLPAIATDWRTTGVSSRTRETVAIDMDSINRVSRYDVRFRYLIGKDLVQASVNCDSSLVTPDQGKSFVPDLIGATREMIKIACSENGYGRVDNQREIRRGVEVRGFWVSDQAIYAARNTLEDSGFSPNSMDSGKIANAIGRYCSARQVVSDSELTTALTLEMAKRNASSDYTDKAFDFYRATRIAAKQYVCPQYND
ncbi:MAG: hypothetical protein KME18_19120 [Phormidium tanganyikae FI6-MK23]|jgi:hypothetical protein|nr:hypothetical protein [Phormidium tanganyikae FI6-MK23]